MEVMSLSAACCDVQRLVWDYGGHVTFSCMLWRTAPRLRLWRSCHFQLNVLISSPCASDGVHSPPAILIIQRPTKTCGNNLLSNFVVDWNVWVGTTALMGQRDSLHFTASVQRDGLHCTASVLRDGSHCASSVQRDFAHCTAWVQSAYRAIAATALTG